MSGESPRQPVESERSRREFVRRAAYIAPVLLTLPAAPALAQVGSGICPPGTAPTYDVNGNLLGCDS